MTMQKVKASISELCYYIFFCILFFAKAIGLYDGQAVFKICLVLAACFVMAKIILTSYDLWELAVILILMVLGLVVYRNSGEKSALVFLVMMIGFKNISLNKVMKAGIVTWSVGFGLMMVKSMLGLENEIVMAHHKFGIDILRRGMGYPHPNVLHVSYAILAVLVLFGLKEGRGRVKTCVRLILGNVFIFLYSASYTGFMLVLIFIFFYLYFVYRKKFSLAEKLLIHGVFPASVLFSLFAPILVEPDTPLFHLLNKALNQRLYASRLYLQENSLTLAGSRIYASHKYALDNSYVTLLIYGGLILFLLVCAGYIYAVYASMKKRDGKSLSLLLSFSIAGVIEPFLFNLSFKNLSLLVVAGCLFSLGKGKREILLLSTRDRLVEINLPMFNGKGIKNVSGRAVLAVFPALIAGAVYFSAVPVPEKVFVGQQYCDVRGDVIYLDWTEYEDDRSVIIYGHSDETDGFYEFGSKTIIFDKIRDTIRIALAVFFVCIIFIAFFHGRDEKTGIRRRG